MINTSHRPDWKSAEKMKVSTGFAITSAINGPGSYGIGNKDPGGVLLHQTLFTWSSYRNIAAVVIHRI